jgi:hypothetical protein
MTAHEFGMWGFSTLVWIFTALSALWGYHLVKRFIHEWNFEKEINDMTLEQIEEQLHEEQQEDDIG